MPYVNAYIILFIFSEYNLLHFVNEEEL